MFWVSLRVHDVVIETCPVLKMSYLNPSDIYWQVFLIATIAGEGGLLPKGFVRSVHPET